LICHIAQMTGSVNPRIGDQRGFFSTSGWQYQGVCFDLLVQSQAHDQSTPDRPQGPRQGQLSSKFVVFQACAIDLPAGRQNAQSNRQIKSARVFGQVRGRQVDRDALVAGKLKT
jgi:hypothetical protein